jgi:hypothetical protein
MGNENDEADRQVERARDALLKGPSAVSFLNTIDGT